MPNKSKKQLQEEAKIVLNSEEVVCLLMELLVEDEYKKKKPCPKFNIQEFWFIRDLIFWKRKGLLFYSLADYLMNNTSLRQLPMFNAPSMRKLQFIYNFISLKSGKQSAIDAGYSPKTAAQQASRILWEINGYKRRS